MQLCAKGFTIKPLTPILKFCDVLGSIEDWAIEPKYDGKRELVYVKKGLVGATSRGGLGTRLPSSIEKELADICSRVSAVFDCELVNEHLFIFDVIKVDETTTANYPYWIRKLILDDLLLLADTNVHVAPYFKLKDRIFGSPEWMDPPRYNDYVMNVREGFIAKRLDGMYTLNSRAKNDWVKIKHEATMVMEAVEVVEESQEQSTVLFRSLPGASQFITAKVVVRMKPDKVNDIIGPCYYINYHKITEDNKLFGATFGNRVNGSAFTLEPIYYRTNVEYSRFRAINT